MLTVTSIGVINTSQEIQKKFALRALEHELYKQCVLVYELWKDDNYELATDVASDGVNSIINEMMYLKTS